MLETLLAFAIATAGYTDFCNASRKCVPPKLVVLKAGERPPAPQPITPAWRGWYSPTIAPGVLYINGDALQPGTIYYETIVVHEITHYLQGLEGRYVRTWTKCDEYLSEKEAYETAAKWALSRGYSTDHRHLLADYQRACEGTSKG